MEDSSETSADAIAEIRRHLLSLPDPARLLEGVFLLAPVGLQIYDASGRSLAVNDTFRKIFGSVPPAGYNVFRDEIAIRLGLHESFRRAFRGETVEIGPFWYDPRELEHVRVDEGRRVAVRIVAFPLLDADGAVRNVAMISSDVTLELEAETKLRESERRFRALIENSADGVALVDAAGIVRYQSAALTRILGYAIEEDVGFEALRRVHQDDRESLLAAVEALGSGNTARCRYRVAHRDGSWRWIESIVTHLLDDPAVRALVFNYRDVTEDVETQAKIERLNASLEARVAERTEQLEAANRDLEAFSYSVSHDLRAPLRAIAGYSSIVLQENAATLPETSLSDLEKVVRNTQQMSVLIDELLAFARLGRKPVQRRRFSLADLVRETIDVLRVETRGRDVEFVVGDLPECNADPGLLKQVVLNLLGNAVKYTRRRERARIEIGCLRGEAEDVYFVRDNGAGFEMRYAAKLFGVFQRLHAAEDYDGVGVGLAIVQRVVQRHGGRVWAEGEVDRGATFFWTLGEGGPSDETGLVGG